MASGQAIRVHQVGALPSGRLARKAQRPARLWGNRDFLWLWTAQTVSQSAARSRAWRYRS